MPTGGEDSDGNLPQYGRATGGARNARRIRLMTRQMGPTTGSPNEACNLLQVELLSWSYGTRIRFAFVVFGPLSRKIRVKPKHGRAASVLMASGSIKVGCVWHRRFAGRPD